MKKTHKKRLSLAKETLRALQFTQLVEVLGGGVNPTVDAQGYGQSCTAACDTGSGAPNTQ
jgi:hypothetical protein